MNSLQCDTSVLTSEYLFSTRVDVRSANVTGRPSPENQRNWDGRLAFAERTSTMGRKYSQALLSVKSHPHAKLHDAERRATLTSVNYPLTPEVRG